MSAGILARAILRDQNETINRQKTNRKNTSSLSDEAEIRKRVK